MIDKKIELEFSANIDFFNNRNYTINIANSFISDFIKDGVLIPKGRIKTVGIDDFDVIIAIPQEKYLSEDFDKYYIKANWLETSSNNPEFHLKIRFINAVSRLMKKKIFCDGYKLKFEVKTSPKL